jgi:cell division protein FtsQ
MSAPFLFNDLSAHAPGRMAADAAFPLRASAGVLAALALILIAGFGILRLLHPMTFPIRQVEINGEFLHLSPAVLRTVAEDVVRGGFFNVNVEAVRRAVLREPWVREVTVRRVWPQSLNLQVQEQQAIAHWGNAGLLNAEGGVFRPDPATFPPGLPGLTGPAGTEQLMLERFRYVEQVFAGQGLQVTALTLSERRAWSLELATGPDVILGRTQFVARVQRFAMAAQHELAGRLDAARVVDMRYTNGFAVQWNTTAATAMENHGQAN